jgi:hypothetical protein
MPQLALFRFSVLFAFPLAIGLLGLNPLSGKSQSRVYSPLPLTFGKGIADKLSNKDIPTGQGGFARDYLVQLQAGDQITIDLASEDFDTMVYLIASDGTTVGENDDGPDGTTNSLLFTRIVRAGTYYIRVRSFGEVGAGRYNLKVTLLKPQ